MHAQLRIIPSSVANTFSIRSIMARRVSLVPPGLRGNAARLRATRMRVEITFDLAESVRSVVILLTSMSVMCLVSPTLNPLWYPSITAL